MNCLKDPGAGRIRGWYKMCKRSFDTKSWPPGIERSVSLWLQWLCKSHTRSFQMCYCRGKSSIFFKKSANSWLHKIWAVLRHLHQAEVHHHWNHSFLIKSLYCHYKPSKGHNFTEYSNGPYKVLCGLLKDFGSANELNYSLNFQTT